eukprot:contig_30435_g7452
MVVEEAPLVVAAGNGNPAAPGKAVAAAEADIQQVAADIARIGVTGNAESASMAGDVAPSSRTAADEVTPLNPGAAGDVKPRKPAAVVDSPGARTRSRGRSTRRGTLAGPPAVVDLTADGSDEEAPPTSATVAVAPPRVGRRGSRGKTPATPGKAAIEVPAGVHPRLGGFSSAPLSPVEALFVEQLTRGRDDATVVCSVPAARITLSVGDFRRLRGSRWLNDELLNSYVAMINERSRAAVVGGGDGDGGGGGGGRGAGELPLDGRKSTAVSTARRVPRGNRRPLRTYCFNTFFHTRLAQGARGYDYAGVARWTTKARVDVLALELVLVPVNLSQYHWVLAAVDMAHHRFLYLDSMHGADGADVILSLRRWLVDEVGAKHGAAAVAA